MEKFEIIDEQEFSLKYRISLKNIEKISFVEMVDNYYQEVYVRLYRISGKTGKPYVWDRLYIDRKFLIPHGLEEIDEC